jgi:hypothetical protein
MASQKMGDGENAGILHDIDYGNRTTAETDGSNGCDR